MAAGFAAVVMVAAIGVGHVTVAYDADVATHRRPVFARGRAPSALRRPEAHRRGDELGIFHLGSTTIAVFEPGRVDLRTLCPGEAMKMGVGIGRSRATNETSPAVPRG